MNPNAFLGNYGSMTISVWFFISTRGKQVKRGGEQKMNKKPFLSDQQTSFEIN
jgi:hypothetical protein